MREPQGILRSGLSTISSLMFNLTDWLPWNRDGGTGPAGLVLARPLFSPDNYRRSGFEYVLKWMQMALYRPDCNSNDCKLPSTQVTTAYRPIAGRHSGVKDALYLRLLPSLAWFPASSHSDAAVTAWFISLRTFGESYVLLDDGTWNF